MNNKVSFNQPESVKVMSETPLKVELIEREKEPIKIFGIISIKWIYIILAVFVLVTLLAWIRFEEPREKEPYSSKPQFVDYSICYPTYIASNDKGTIELTLLNKSTKPFNEVKLSFIYNKEEIPIIINSKEGSTITDFGTISIGEAKTKKIEFQLNPSFNKNEITFTLEITAPEIISQNMIPIKKKCTIIVPPDIFRRILKGLFGIFTVLINSLVVITISEIVINIIKKPQAGGKS
ncbi:MAG: hypothetical protein GTN82_12885 [Candidatus Aminicenantes bacterium]|nr:hypothetical protein [Candidatus Aminicenantes bacterium]